MVQQQDSNSLSIPTKEDWLEKTVRLAQDCNQIFAQTACRLCHVYVDQQVEFEQRQESQRDWMRPAAEQSLEVNMYRQFLFDEDSVVEGVSGRVAEETEDSLLDKPNDKQQRTQ